MAAAVALALGLGVVTALAVRDGGPPQAAEQPLDPSRVAGTWWVKGWGDLDGRLLALLPTGEASVYGSNDCRLMGTWSATVSGLATLLISAGSGRCGQLLDTAHEASSAISGFRLRNASVRLIDSSGSSVAVLAPATDPQAWPDAARSDPDLTSALAADYVGEPDPAPLPPGLAPPTVDDLVRGRWLPVDTVDSDRWLQRARPYVAFEPSTWAGSDGCNGLGGHWTLDPSTGEWLASTGGQTQIGCDNVNVTTMIVSARSVAVDDDQLVFSDADGAEVGRFVRG